MIVYKYQEKYFINQFKFVNNLAKAPRESLSLDFIKINQTNKLLNEELMMQFDQNLKLINLKLTYTV